MLPIRDVNPTSIRPLLTWLIIAVNAIVFLAVQPPDEPDATEFVYRYSAIACEVTTGDPLTVQEIQTGVCRDAEDGAPLFGDKQILLSIGVSMFLHAGLAHILFNMWSLWIFGNNVEEAFGQLGYLVLYLSSGLVATLTFVVLNPELTVPLVGASGAIAGIMGSYLVLFPRHQVMTLIVIRIVAMPALFFLGIWFVSQFLLTGDGIAWEAHVGGFVFGALVTLPFRRRLLENTLAGRRADTLIY
jgi:membrane associated rhomboid family serine protease